MCHWSSVRSQGYFSDAMPAADVRWQPPPCAVSRPETPGSGARTELNLSFSLYSFSNWPRAPLNHIRLTAENTFPLVGPDGQRIRATADWVARDPFPVINRHGTLARINGWYVVAALAAPRGTRFQAEFDYLASRDGVHWQEGGTLISTGPPGGLGDILFSGSAVYDAAQNKVFLFYTPVQGARPEEWVPSPSGRQMRQEVAVAEATPVATAREVLFTDYVQHGIRLRADGQWYALPERANTESEVVGFRDPFLFHDPASGRDFLLFAGNWGSDQTTGVGSTGDIRFPGAGPSKVDPRLPRNDGVIGWAVATDGTLTNWRLLPPLFGGIGVNEQLELPHLIYQGGRYYLFFTTHSRTFLEDLKFKHPDGLYGFVADAPQGPYRPLNGTGLALANRPEDTLQNYAWKATPIGGGDAVVLSYINRRDSGTISPVVKIRLEGDRAVISGLQPPPGAGPPDTVLAFGDFPTAPLHG
jgi:levansucrase